MEEVRAALNHKPTPDEVLQAQIGAGIIVGAPAGPAITSSVLPMPSNFLELSPTEKSVAYQTRATKMEEAIAVAEATVAAEQEQIRQTHTDGQAAVEHRHGAAVGKEERRHTTVVSQEQHNHETTMKRLDTNRATSLSQLDVKMGKQLGSIRQTVNIKALRAQIRKDRENADHYSGGGGAAVSSPPAPRERPPEHSCPISMEVMTDPVIAMDGNTYERSAIEQWLRTNDTSPLTNETLPNKTRIPNLSFRKIIQDF
jgi:hypothetical protein